MTVAGIYQIRNRETGMVYVGGAQDLHHRWSQHLTDLRRGVHINARLQQAWRQYGEAAFSFEILQPMEDASTELLRQAEQVWMDHLQSYDDRYGYNINPTADGSIRSAETCNKISKAKQGEGHHLHRLSEAQVIEIKTRLAGTETIAEIAADYGVSRGTIGDIRRGCTWAHIAWPAGLPKAGKQGEGRYNARLRAVDVIAIKRNLIDGLETKAIARDYNVTQQAIVDIKFGRTWKHIPWPGVYKPQRDGILSITQVENIRARLAQGETGRQIARDLGISEQSLSAIKHKRNYK